MTIIMYTFTSTCFIVFLIVTSTWCSSNDVVYAFIPSSSHIIGKQQRQQRRLSSPIHYNSRIVRKATIEDNRKDDNKTTNNNKTGAEFFEQWLLKQPNTFVHPAIKHYLFYNGFLRGLAWLSTTNKILEKSTKVAEIPSNLVLSSNDKEEWDTELAVQLIQECKKGNDSNIVGYCRLLMNTNNSDNSNNFPSTAPNALRHWTDKEKEDLLSQTNAGKKLLDLEQKQIMKWKTKYDKIITNNNNNITWEQFQWGMEVVHSRAFRGIGGSGSNTLLQSVAPAIGAPIFAAIAGYWYVNNVIYTNEAVLIGLAGFAILPTLASLLFQQNTSSSSSVVLLPLIDSANHNEYADSKIEYNPIKDCFELSIGTKCLIQEENDNVIQLYISYGTNKSDIELLLNYGFLPDVSICQDNTEYRKRLANAFNQRNNNT